MASVYPGALDTFATNKADATVMATDHPGHHNDLADAINKIEPKIGTGSSTPVANSVLASTGTGVSAWATSGVKIGTGDNQNYVTAAAAVGSMLHISKGTAGVPDTATEPAFKVERTVSITSSFSGDGADELAAIVGVTVADAANVGQPVGVLGIGKSASTASGNNDDACGVYGVGRITGSGTGTGIGAACIGRRDVDTGKATGAEYHVGNFTSTAGSYNSTGYPTCGGLWIVAGGNEDSGAASVVGNPNGRQFKVGYAINGQVVGGKTGGVADAGWRTDGNETTVFDVNGSHTDGFDLTGATLTGAALKLAAAHTLVVGGVNTRILPSGLRPAGALYETLERDKNAFTNNALLVSQRLQMVAIDLPAGLTVTSISVQSGTTALVTGAHQIFGLYDDSLGSSSATPRALLRGSSDDTSTAWGSNTVKTLTLTSTYTTTRAGLFYIGVLVDAATPPTLWIGATIGSGPQGVAPIVAGSSSTGVTALPNPAAALTANNAMFWAWVN